MVASWASAAPVAEPDYGAPREGDAPDERRGAESNRGTWEPDARGDDGTPPHDTDDAPDEGRRTDPTASSASEPGADDDQVYSELGAALGQRVYNTFYGRVDAGDAVFGFGAAAAPGLAPGFVEPAEIDRVLRDYLHPDGYDEAAGRLQDDHILVLVGEDGSGRRAGAFAMLRDLLGRGTGLQSLSPANSLADLTERDGLKAEVGYVILDYVGETHPDAVQEFAVKKLQGALRNKGSYLVLTAAPAAQRRLALRAFCVPWHPPDPLPLFDHCLARPPEKGAAPRPDVPPELAAELRERVGELRRPGDVVKAVRGLTESPTAALLALRDGAKQTVRDWFGTRPPADDLLPMAALAFAEGLPERTFEELSVLLGVHVRNWDRSADGTPPDEGVPVPQPYPDIEQSRARWSSRAVGIAEPVRRTEQGTDHCRSERMIVFASPRVRELVIGELHSLYGYGLWYPLRQWLHQLSVESGPDVRAEVARGVALLAKYALPEVEENLLRPWADGTTSQRLTAAFVLQFMCADERLAPQALSTALGWSQWGAGQSRAITAAMAFAGEVGSVYRFKAVDCLWGLTGRGQRVAVAARRSLVLFLATAEREPERALFFFRYVRTQLAHVRTRKERSDALETVVQVLAAERLNAMEPLAAFLLRTDVRTAPQLGSLWISALLSVRRGRAVAALCRTLAALQDDPAATRSVRALGESMRSALDHRQWEALRGAVSSALRHPEFAIPGTQRLARVLLDSMRRHAPADAVSVLGG